MHDPIDNVVCVGEPSYTVLVEHLGLELYILIAIGGCWIAE